MEKLASIQQNKLHDVTTVILFSLGLLPHVTTGGPSANVVGLPMGPGFNMEPYFVGGSGQIVNITVLKGQTARMECRVQNLGAKQVKTSRRPLFQPDFCCSSIPAARSYIEVWVQ